MAQEEISSNNQEETIISLKNEDAKLNNEIEQLKSSRTTIDRTEYQNSQTRFSTIFEYSRLGNKIITADLKLCR